MKETRVGHGCEMTQSGLFALMYSTYDFVVSSAPKLTSKTARMPCALSQPLSSRSFPLKLTIAAGATMATIGTFFSKSLKNASASSMPLRASWVQARIHAPQPRHRSAFTFTYEPEPSLHIFDGQTEMHRWQLTHLSGST